jgi:chitinase
LKPLILTNCFFLSLLDAKDYKLVCYYGAWAIYRDAPMNFGPDKLDGLGCTHIIYSFAGLDNQTYEIVSLDPKMDIEEG